MSKKIKQDIKKALSSLESASMICTARSVGTKLVSPAQNESGDKYIRLQTGKFVSLNKN